MWKSWVDSIKYLRMGLRVHIADEKTTKIWRNPWIPTLLEFKARTCEHNANGLEWVSQLMMNDGKEWNNQLIENIFSKAKAEAILKIPLKDHNKADSLVWNLNTKGSFSVKSAYNMILKKEHTREIQPECSSGAGQQLNMWKRTWCLKIEPDVGYVRRMMKQLGMFFSPVVGLRRYGSYLLCLGKVYLLWWLWKTRNLWVFEKKWLDEVVVVRRAIMEWQDSAGS
ncbi:ribonuclease H-like superfamily protein [Striga asiatica]|uniref:Ribonuclease H-like superfamily protein n=1 Tax=Striga asiatica TaxID=4170 RepID=A0A5A7PV63_STRAF|nr:ribonuclease H-like superfamily protein [Striga asiatica]